METQITPHAQLDPIVFDWSRGSYSVAGEREQRFTKAKENRNILLKLIEDVKIDRYKGRRQDLVTAFKKIFSPGKPNLAFFHKLETVDDDELQEMLNEATILDIFEKQLRKRKSRV